MRKFLWSDYFHDSLISDVSFLDASAANKWPRNLFLTLYCDCDCANAYQSLPVKKRPGVGRGFLMSGPFTYRLTFYNVMQFDFKSDGAYCEYINGRFKDSRLVRELNAESKTPYYHFRIQLGYGYAYMDIVFQKFQIRKLQGRVNYAEPPLDELVRSSSHPFAETADWLPPEEAEDWTRFGTLQKLYCEGNPALASYARDCLRSALPLEDSKPYAAYLLGKAGDKSDLEAVKTVYFQTKNELQKKHLADAIEELEAKR